MSAKLDVTVLTADQTLYKGPAIAVSSINYKGKFDILPFHANYISIIQGKVVVRVDNKDKKEFAVTRGLIKCSQDKVWVLLGV